MAWVITIVAFATSSFELFQSLCEVLSPVQKKMSGFTVSAMCYNILKSVPKGKSH